MTSKESNNNIHFAGSPLKCCRACGNRNFTPLLNLGNQFFTGRFPHEDQPEPPAGPLELVICSGEQGCGLVQLSHLFDATEMYGETYGYASSVTETMRDHLSEIAGYVASWTQPTSGANILDIGSNDGTLLNFLRDFNVNLYGIDPSAEQYRHRYPKPENLITDFFSRAAINKLNLDKKFQIITSIAMFYDIDDPISFMEIIRDNLELDGVWLTEQSHAAALINRLCYDSICHEHSTYLTLKIMRDMARKVGLRIIDVRTNQINGGSFSVLFTREESSIQPNLAAVRRLDQSEEIMELGKTNVWTNMALAVHAHRQEMISYLRKEKEKGSSIYGLGASTKGNVILQYCGIDQEIMTAIMERDKRKVGLRTPGTSIPIISEEDGRNAEPDIFVVFPWHFRDEIIRREQEFLKNGGKLVFPLPEFTVVSKM